ncbi:MAG: hypothetical protein GC192_22490 [Bacteroidetes bacterium]|nr:hypothetical protein [Bacteroidota bacterium]
MKFLRQLSLFALLVVLAFASCKKDEVMTTVVDPPIVNPSQELVNGLVSRSVANADGLELGCVSIDYSFEMLLLDSTTVTITSEDDFIQAINDTTNYPIDFVYPLNVTDADGNSQTVGNVEELAALFTYCIPNTGWGNEVFPAWDINLDNSCYQLVFPLNLLNEDSVTVTANDEDELIGLLADGHFYSFTFPLQLENVEGNTATAANAEELFDLLASCGASPGGCGIGSFGCYEFGYPLTLIDASGNAVVVNNIDEFAVAAMEGNWVGFGFPLTLIDADGNQLTINSQEEMDEALFDCGDIIDPNVQLGDIICYDFVYPISITEDMGVTIIVINDQDALHDYQSSNNGNVPFDFVYPISLVHVETGVTTTVNSPDEMGAALADCF